MKRLLAVGVLAASLAAGSAADWARFRGPNGTGAVDGDAPVKFDLSSDVDWKTEIPGTGYGSPIVVKAKVFLQSAEDNGAKQHLVCVDATTGKIAWTKDIASPAAPKMHNKNSPASGTPASDGERVYVAVWLGSAYAIHAFDLAGKPLWDTPVGKYASQHGAAHSPMVFDGKVYFNLDQDDAAKLVALDAKTGKIAWQKDRKANRASYTTPFVLEEQGKPVQLIVGSTTGVNGYDPKTGDVLWSYDIKWKAGAKQLRAVGQQVIAAGNVVTYTGEGGADRYMVAVKLGGKGDVTATGKAWEVTGGKSPYVPSMVVYKDHLYWVSDQGIAGCADAKTGKEVWTDRLFPKAVSASPILIGDAVLCVDEDGRVKAFKATPKGLDELGDSSVKEKVLASPAAADGKLYIRTAKHLFRIGGKKS